MRYPSPKLCRWTLNISTSGHVCGNSYSQNYTLRFSVGCAYTAHMRRQWQQFMKAPLSVTLPSFSCKWAQDCLLWHDSCEAHRGRQCPCCPSKLPTKPPGPELPSSSRPIPALHPHILLGHLLEIPLVLTEVRHGKQPLPDLFPSWQEGRSHLCSLDHGGLKACPSSAESRGSRSVRRELTHSADPENARKCTHSHKRDPWLGTGPALSMQAPREQYRATVSFGTRNVRRPLGSNLSLDSKVVLKLF